jgi:hypothetical protein
MTGLVRARPFPRAHVPIQPIVFPQLNFRCPHSGFYPALPLQPTIVEDIIC